MYDEFHQLKIFLAQKHNTKPRNIVIEDDHPVGEIVIYVDGQFEGYLDENLEIEVADFFDDRL